ncbi:hypothetical protein BY457_103186 [Marinilabilia salmonicolor]|jgi:hypothetical protein|uniref:hypothetical protein n=1 Tax=Marinilabilia salmonicolor TaxID=989 RepID=UPI000D080BF2|nr:hypothetical protein [Marinilabilia salmonicolor]PRZ01371.1 hypothetical protein BY457_103186 [Marinilabilia salmonicolor]
MRKLIFTLLLLVGVGFSGANAQCNHEALLKDALAQMGDGQYIKDFIVDLKNDKGGESGTVKYSVILNSRSQYKFNVVNGGANSEKVHMQLYDGDKLLVSNKAQGKMYSAFGFVCRSTKVYSLVFSFPEGNEGCARAVLSLQKQFAAGEGGF